MTFQPCIFAKTMEESLCGTECRICFRFIIREEWWASPSQWCSMRPWVLPMNCDHDTCYQYAMFTLQHHFHCPVDTGRLIPSGHLCSGIACIHNWFKKTKHVFVLFMGTLSSVVFACDFEVNINKQQTPITNLTLSRCSEDTIDF